MAEVLRCRIGLRCFGLGNLSDHTSLAMLRTNASQSEPRTLVTHPELRSQRSIPVFVTIGEAPKSMLERALSVFADVRAGEGIGVILLAVNVFLLLAGYYLLKTAREALILTEGGAEVKAYSSAAQAVLLIGVVPAWLAPSRVVRINLIAVTSVFFASNLVLFYLFGSPARAKASCSISGWDLQCLVIAQFWAFANDLYTEGQSAAVSARGRRQLARRVDRRVGRGAARGAGASDAARPHADRRRRAARLARDHVDREPPRDRAGGSAGPGRGRRAARARGRVSTDRIRTVLL
jgi:hypothetical protein